MASSKRREKPEFIPSVFFVLRTPVLSFDELLGWSNGLEAQAAMSNPARLEQALGHDRARLRARLQGLISRTGSARSGDSPCGFTLISPDSGLFRREKPPTKTGEGTAALLACWVVC
jgi:hypothetical protein